MMLSLPIKSRKVKLEKPRPLKISTLADHSMEGVLGEMDLVSQILSGPVDRSVYPVLAALCENLKMFGPQLENVYKDQLDKCYISLRNGCRDDRLSLAVRYRLLEVIELRAMHWQPNENLTNYYRQKLVQIEAEEAALEGENDTFSTQSTPLMTPTGTSLMFPGIQAYQPLYNATQSAAQTPTSCPATPIILNPGEVIKNSGKFTKPTRIPGKNYCKDEVVIRNADSGKVMGIKGRRVHMIEEMSETVISFQRVAPGARERLVQITGPAEENIAQAKQLIEETIRRNASPVRSDERSSIFSGSGMGGSSSSLSSHTSDDTLHGSKRPGLALVGGDDSLGDYRYTVTHHAEQLRITGNNLQLVRTAKLVLDEFFNGERNLNNIAIMLSDSSDRADSPKSSYTPKTSSPSPQPPSVPQTPLEEGEARGVVQVIRQPLFPSSSKEAFESAEVGAESKNRRALFQKTSEERQASLTLDDSSSPPSPSSCSPVPPTAACSSPSLRRHVYSREEIVGLAASPLSRLTPANWASVVRNAPLVLKKSWQYQPGLVARLSDKGQESTLNSAPTYLQPSELEDAAALLKKELKWTLVRTVSTQEDEDNGNKSS